MLYSPDPRVLLFLKNFWLYWVFVAVRGLSPLAVNGGYFPGAVLVGFSLWLFAEHGL